MNHSNVIRYFVMANSELINCNKALRDVVMGTVASQITSLIPLFTQPFIQAQIKENIKAPRHWTLCGEFTGTGEFPAQRSSYAENISMWWRHHGFHVSHRVRASMCGYRLLYPPVYSGDDVLHVAVWSHNRHWLACLWQNWLMYC